MSRDARTPASEPDWDRRSSASASLNATWSQGRAPRLLRAPLRRTEGASRAIVYHTQQGPPGTVKVRVVRTLAPPPVCAQGRRRGACLSRPFDPLMRPRPLPGPRHVMQTDGEGCPRSPGPGPWELVVAAVRYLAPFLFNE